MSDAQSILDMFFGLGADFFAFIVVAAVIAGFAFYFGGDRLIPLTAAIYAAIPIYGAFIYRDMLPDGAYISLGLYLLIVLIAAAAFSGLIIFGTGGGIGFVKLLGLSVLTAGLLLAVAIHNLPIQEVYVMSPPTLALFGSDTAYLAWLTAPLAGLFLFGRS